LPLSLQLKNGGVSFSICAKGALVDKNKIFFSYRRTDTADISSLIYQRLKDRFGAKNVFMDVHDSPIGQYFSDTLKNQIKQSLVVLVLIGPDWLDVTLPEGQRRLDEPEDWVRKEIECAMMSDAHILPVCVKGARMPPENQLPSSIQKLARITALHVEREALLDEALARIIEYCANAMENADRMRERLRHAQDELKEAKEEARVIKLNAQAAWKPMHVLAGMVFILAACAAALLTFPGKDQHTDATIICRLCSER
jgi:hypothetical protein